MKVKSKENLNLTQEEQQHKESVSKGIKRKKKYLRLTREGGRHYLKRAQIRQLNSQHGNDRLKSLWTVYTQHYNLSSALGLLQETSPVYHKKFISF